MVQVRRRAYRNKLKYELEVEKQSKLEVEERNWLVVEEPNELEV